MADYYFKMDDMAVGYQGKTLIHDINIGIDKGEIVRDIQAGTYE